MNISSCRFQVGLYATEVCRKSEKLVSEGPTAQNYVPIIGYKGNLLVLGVVCTCFSFAACVDIDLANLSVSKGIPIHGGTALDQSGWSVSGAGDVNADGYGDVIIGAKKAQVGAQAEAGIAYVLFGQSGPFSGFPLPGPSVPLSASVGFRILGAVAFDNNGHSVSGAGDVNNDGIDDVIVGAPLADVPTKSAAGITYIIFGRDLSVNGAIPFGDIYVTSGSTPIGTYIGFRVIGFAGGDRCGSSVSNAGDVNGDNIDDIIIGAFNANGAAGISYVIFGRDVATTGDFSDIPLPGTVMNADVGFRILGAAVNDVSGSSVSAAGDINNDGVDDVIIGAKGADPISGTDAGISYVIFGRKLSIPGATPFGDIQLTTGASLFDTDIGFRILGATGTDRCGVSVSGAGDVNGDNIDDLIIGASDADLPSRTDAGVAYVIFGRDYNDGNVVKFNEVQLTSGVNPLPTDEGFRIIGGAAGDYLGFSVRTAGDTNGDGIGDIIIGAYAADPVSGGSTAGITYLLYGRSISGGAAAFGDIDLSAPLSDVDGYRMLGAATTDYSGYSVSGAGDINNDGMDDIIMGAFQADVGGETDVGTSYILFGFNLYPTSQPSSQPSRQPSMQPSRQPTMQPTMQPLGQPTMQPSQQPTAQPSTQPLGRPSSQPSSQPSAQPSASPSAFPSSQPTAQPTSTPSSQPTSRPSTQPSAQPSSHPSMQPSTQPSAQPSLQPTTQPSSEPTGMPTTYPTTQPTSRPSTQPSGQPTSNPTTQPSNHPSSQPSTQPSGYPTAQPTSVPSMQPSSLPSTQPTSQPTIQPTSAPSEQPFSEPSGQPSVQPSVSPSTQPSTQPTKQPTNQPSMQPSSQPVSAPTSVPTITGEWVNVFNGSAQISTIVYGGDVLWSCGRNNQSLFMSKCATFDSRNGNPVSHYMFQWSDVSFLLPVTTASNVVLGGVTFSPAQSITDIVYCSINITQLQCSVQSYVDTILAAGTYVPFSKKNVYVGTYNYQATVAIHNIINGATSVYRYSTNKMASITLTQIRSPPVFIGAFVAGSCLSTALQNHICTGMVRTDSGLMTAMYLTLAVGNIVNSDQLVNAMALEYENPDTFIAGGLELSDGTGMHAYLVRVNSLYYSVLYGMRYRVASQAARRTLTEAGVCNTVVKGMVRVDSSLFMVVNVRSTSMSTTTTSVTLLKVDLTTGRIAQQVQIESQHASVQCTDITASELYLAIACTTTKTNVIQETTLFTVDRDLTFSALPEGFRRYENNTLIAEPVLFRRTALMLSASSVQNAYTEYTFNTADGYRTAYPTRRPTSQPSSQPSSAPSGQPSSSPTAAPSVSPQPTSHPSSSGPTNTYRPTVKPTQRPSTAPSRVPTVSPTVRPTIAPTVRPSMVPSVTPSTVPTVAPTLLPTRCPTVRPTRIPTMVQTTYIPTIVPTSSPTQRGRRVYEAYASMILGYVVGCLIIVWCIYQLTLFGIYKAGLVKADEKLMDELRSIGLTPKPRHPVSKILLQRFIKAPSRSESLQIIANNVQTTMSTNVVNSSDATENTPTAIINTTTEPRLHEVISPSINPGADILRQIIQENEQTNSPRMDSLPVLKGAFANSSHFIDLEANISTSANENSNPTKEAGVHPPVKPLLTTTESHSTLLNLSQKPSVGSKDSVDSDIQSVNSSKMSDWIDKMLEKDSISDSSSSSDSDI